MVSQRPVSNALSLTTTTGRRALWRVLILALLCAAPMGMLSLSVAPPSVALAQEDNKIKGLLAGAQEDYELVMLDEALQKLDEGIAYATSNDINTEQAAQLHLLRGIVLFANGPENEAVTEQAFVAGIETFYDVKLNPVYATPELERIMKNARAKAKRPATEDVPSAGAVSSFSHKYIIKATHGEPLDVEADVPENLPVFRMFVYHRRFGEDDYTSTEMRPKSATTFKGVIPAEQIKTSQIEYYIDVLDRGGESIANAGSSIEPITFVVLGGPDDDGSTTPKTGDPTTPVVPVEEGVEEANVYVMVGGGSGLGFLPGGVPTANPVDRNVEPGIAPAFGHALLDIGWVINNTMRLGLFWRYQFSPPQDFDQLPPELQAEYAEGSFLTNKEECFGTGLSGDCVIGMKYKYFFSDDSPDQVRFYSTVGLGVGRLRHWLQLQEAAYREDGRLNPNCEGKETFQNSNGVAYCFLRDTVRTGWLNLGLGGGITVPLGSVVEFVADAYLMFAAIDQTSITLDGNLGFVFKF